MHLKNKQRLVLSYLLVFVIFAFSCCLLNVSARNSHQSTVTDVTDDYEHLEHPVSSGENVADKKPSDILGKFGLGKIVPQIVAALDHADGLITDMTNEKHFNAVNKVIKAFIRSFESTIAPAMSANDRPQGAIRPETMNNLLDAQAQHFNDDLLNDRDVQATHLKHFIHQYADQIFLTLKDGYTQMFKMGLQLTWSLIFMVMPFLSLIPTDIFSRDMLGEVLEVPGQLKQFVHDTLESVFSGDKAHFVEMIIHFVSTMISSQTEKVEL